MKRLFVFVFAMTLLGSCSILVPSVVTPIEYVNKKNNPEKIKYPNYKKVKQDKYTHSEYMSNFKLKRDVIEKWGAPTKKDTIEGIEIWYYGLGEVYNSRNSGIGTQNTLTKSVTVTASKKTTVSEKYVEFQFNKNDNTVQRWRSKGVDYSSRGKKEKINTVENAKPRIVLLLLKNLLIGIGIDTLILLAI